MGELVRAVESLNVLGDETTDGIKQRRLVLCLSSSCVFSDRRVISLYCD